MFHLMNKTHPTGDLYLISEFKIQQKMCTHVSGQDFITRHADSTKNCTFFIYRMGENPTYIREAILRDPEGSFSFKLQDESKFDI